MQEFKAVYSWRWNFDRVKNIFEVVLFLATVESVLTKTPQAELAEQDRRRQHKTKALVNRAVS